MQSNVRTRDTAQRRLEQLEVAQAIGRRITAVLDVRAFVDELTRAVQEHYGYQHVDLFVWSATRHCLCRQSGDAADDQAESDLPLAAAGVLAEALKRDAPLVPTRGQAILPIHYGGQVSGVIDVHGGRPDQPAVEELVGLQAVADQVGVALHNCELYIEAIKARKQAEDADRVKTRLLANVSHELRAPLNVILGYSQVALAVPNSYGVELPESLRHDLEHIYGSGDHLMRLINDLLDLSRAEVDALDLFPQAIEPRGFFEEIFHSAAHNTRVQPGVAWRLDLAPRLPAIHADPVRLRQVLDNLLSNARASTSSGEIVLGAEVEGRQLHVWVRDTGDGIPGDLHERVFEAFVSGERSDRRRKGIGLGLTITRRLVALHGGTIDVESASGQGSTFHVRLPLPQERQATTGQVSVLMKPVDRGAVLGAIEAIDLNGTSGSVLIVDDDPQARTLYTRLVLDALPGCSIETAEHGGVALRMLETQLEPPILVILDLVMPEVDGLTVLERLRAERRTRHVPVLLVSGRLLTPADLSRLDHALVLYQTKDLLSPSEAVAVVQQAAAGRTLLPQPTSVLVKQALVYVHAHFGRSLARHDIALAVGVSENYLSQIFHRELGISPLEYLSRLRIHSAKELLSTTRHSITSIAERVGFEDPAYFSRVFPSTLARRRTCFVNAADWPRTGKYLSAAANYYRPVRPVRVMPSMILR